LGALAVLAIVVGLTSVAHATTAQCNGSVKWNGDILNPSYIWILDLNNQIVFCPNVLCDDTHFRCTKEVSFPDPVTGLSHSNCYCPGIETSGTCTTSVASNAAGAIVSVSCISNACTLTCKLKAQGGPDPNGYYTVSCKCE
jgi:hypothetical protein